MNMMGLLLIIPFFFIRFFLLSFFSQNALLRAAYFAPLNKNEYIAYYIYQISNVFLFIYMLFLNVNIDFSWQFYTGLFIYIFGILLLTISIVQFALAEDEGLNTKGIYRLSRNPMYISYFVYFIGCVLLTQSFLLLLIVMIFQISAHWIILSEERWCVQQFQERYIEYMKEVRRYI